MTDKKQFHMRPRTTCRICGGTNLTCYLDLGQQPPSNSFIAPADIADEESFPLEIYRCADCGMSQLGHVVAATDIFDDYVYLSSTSKALCDHYQGLIDAALAAFGPPDGALMLDIGCNDGIMLKGYPPERFSLLGVEPSSAGAQARAAGFTVIEEFFGAEAGARICQEHGPAQIITATNVFAHVDDIGDFARGVHALLAADGVFIIEFPYLGDMLSDGYFDTIYHEHLSYLALTPLLRLFAETGLRAFRVERTAMGASGPALRLFVCRADAAHVTDATIGAMRDDEMTWGILEPGAYEDFAHRVADIRTRLLAIIGEHNAGGGRVGAFGAPAKGNTLLNYLGLTAADIVAVAENNDLKVGKVTPGSHIPIVDDAAFLDAGITHAVLLSWNYVDFFLAKAPFIQLGGKFIVPLPDPCIRP